MATNPVVWQEGSDPPPVSPTHPLVGLELQVLQTWLENSRPLRASYRTPEGCRHLESAAREAVESARAEELRLRGQGASLEEAQSLTRPAMWTPPTLPPPTT